MNLEEFHWNLCQLLVHTITHRKNSSVPAEGRNQATTSFQNSSGVFEHKPTTTSPPSLDKYFLMLPVLFSLSASGKYSFLSFLLLSPLFPAHYLCYLFPSSVCLKSKMFHICFFYLSTSTRLSLQKQ